MAVEACAEGVDVLEGAVEVGGDGAEVVEHVLGLALGEEFADDVDDGVELVDLSGEVVLVEGEVEPLEGGDARGDDVGGDEVADMVGGGLLAEEVELDVEESGEEVLGLEEVQFLMMFLQEQLQIIPVNRDLCHSRLLARIHFS